MYYTVNRRILRDADLMRNKGLDMIQTSQAAVNTKFVRQTPYIYDPLADVSGLLQGFECIDLVSLEAVSLLNRIDTKFVLRKRDLIQTLQILSQQYQVLEIAGQRMHAYHTQYFDTDNFDLYLAHHNQHRIRYKLRSRQYVDSGLNFLEVKQKVNDERTIKNRINTAELLSQLTPDVYDFVAQYVPYDPQQLFPTLSNRFYRITLVSKYQQERLTLDIGLQFSYGDQVIDLPEVVIAEVKQGGFERNAAFIQQMRAMNIRPRGFSKYCIGTAMTNPFIKHNEFKPVLQLVNSMIEGQNNA